MDSHHHGRPSSRTTMVPANSIAVRSRFRHSPTISTQQQKTATSNTASCKDSPMDTSTMPSRLARNSFQSRYQANRWAGPPSPTKGSSSNQPQSGSDHINNNNNHDSSNNNNNNSSSHNTRSLTPAAQTASKLRSRVSNRARGGDPPPTTTTTTTTTTNPNTLPSPAKTTGTATTAPSTTKSGATHPNSISLTRRRLSQPIVNTPPKATTHHHHSHPGSSDPYHGHLQPPPQHHHQHQHHQSNIMDDAGGASGDELVCDYDTSATVLYELLESSQWDEARSRCRSYSTEVKTWIVRRDKTNKVRWKLLPLHAAIIFQSPNTVVSSLLEKYPHAASCPDDQGMLPLHLAFRHKQEDEDLLELLLVQYPKAVLIKDKRGRVPLEHGRESKFSAKLVWLYADATVIATKANQPEFEMGDQGTARTALTTEQRREIERELHQEHEKEMEQVRQDYENKIRSLEEKNSLEAQHVKLVLDDERQTLIERHTEEVAELKEMLNQQNEHEANLVGDLQAQMDDLQAALENAQRQNDGLTLKYGKMEEFNRELRNQLQTIIRDQLFMRDLATRQNNELDAARKMRAQIIQTLMQQEDTDGENDRMRSNKLIEMAENVRDRIHDILRNDPSENFEMEDDPDGLHTPGNPNGGGGGAGGQLGPSRIEMERGGHDQNNGLFMEDHHPGGFFEERDDVFLAKIPEVELRESEALADMKSLGDEISGITEHSPY